VKGGHLRERACDVLATAAGIDELDGSRIAVGPVRGTGCTLAAAIAAGLARGRELDHAVRVARDYVRRAIAASLPIGHGSRLLDHAITPDES
jgi:hydroxymethylpyrimidine/phosphomethylpyrimidine kinase